MEIITSIGLYPPHPQTSEFRYLLGVSNYDWPLRVFNPFAKSHLTRKLETVFRSNETIKRTAYNARVIQVEHGSFTPVVFSSFGGCGKETSCFISNIVEKLSTKHGMENSVVANYIRTKVSFELIRSQVACIRGSRSLKKINIDTNEIEEVKIRIE